MKPDEEWTSREIIKAGWESAGIYGQYRTASSVAYQLRSNGWKTKITQDTHGNATVWKHA